ncbi:hypothetical protein ACLBXM_01005 [Xanthobacteraceae bacterium A53D]
MANSETTPDTATTPAGRTQTWASLSEPAETYTHPEEVKASWAMRIGPVFSIEASARCTPAGIIAGGIAASAILLAVGWMLRARRR